ncbi:MAG: type II toxin-antitoxin system prevent-host-death family antitoxin [Chloroflexi bacterium]|nr:type II toxin-antitoxin system prevent-host-death family antitoxin [Chloroflexota bacterium]
MKTVTVLELKAKASELVRSVVRMGEEIQITDQGTVVALLVSPERTKIKDTGKAWITLDQLAAEIRSERNVD